MTEPSVSPKATVQSDQPWIWYFVTIVYLVFGGVVLYDRWGEIGSPFEPPAANSGRLPLNSIGDILAGFFAPLAFLWLFVATQLQRKELKLQREELAETRVVLGEQRLELERSAAESNNQTSIMQMNLEYSRTRELYEDFNLKLYFIARYIYRDKKLQITSSYKPWNDYESAEYYGLFKFENEIYLSQSDTSTVDLFFERLSHRIQHLVGVFGRSRQIVSVDTLDNKNVLHLLRYLSKSISDLESSDLYKNNSLITIRMSGNRLSELSVFAEILASYIVKLPDEEALKNFKGDDPSELIVPATIV